MQKIILAADHAGFELKEKLKKYLAENSFQVNDLSPVFVDSDDYPDVVFKAAKTVVKEKTTGIFICGSGIGTSICANKVKGVRAALCYDEKTARMSKHDNNANVLCLGARLTDEKKAIAVLKTWLSNGFLEGRHRRRIDKIADFEKEN